MALTPGDTAVLKRQVVQGATGDHPSFLLGQKGERVTIVQVDGEGAYPYTVVGPTNPDMTWLACQNDFQE